MVSVSQGLFVSGTSQLSDDMLDMAVEGPQIRRHAKAYEVMRRGAPSLLAAVSKPPAV